MVVTCAEEAALRLEEHLIAPALQDIREPGSDDGTAAAAGR